MGHGGLFGETRVCRAASTMNAASIGVPRDISLPGIWPRTCGHVLLGLPMVSWHAPRPKSRPAWTMMMAPLDSLSVEMLPSPLGKVAELDRDQQEFSGWMDVGGCLGLALGCQCPSI